MCCWDLLGRINLLVKETERRSKRLYIDGSNHFVFNRTKIEETGSIDSTPSIINSIYMPSIYCYTIVNLCNDVSILDIYSCFNT
jgi:hypothetical protein